MEYAIEIVLCAIILVYVSYFMKIGTGVQETLRNCFRNLRGCNVGITDVRN
jgi:hypothetical protein